VLKEKPPDSTSLDASRSEARKNPAGDRCRTGGAQRTSAPHRYHNPAAVNKSPACSVHAGPRGLVSRAPRLAPVRLRRVCRGRVVLDPQYPAWKKTIDA
jgi:hypothetical protein